MRRVKRGEMQNLDDERRPLILQPRAHLEAGIFRKKIAAAYFDAGRAGMTPNECIRTAITEGALTLLGNRGVELRGLSHQELAKKVWEQIRPNAAALCAVKGFAARSRQVVAVVTRNLTDAALEFWKRHAGEESLAR
jgi:hypothetical protein